VRFKAKYLDPETYSPPPAGIRWIKGGLIGFTYKMKNTKAETNRTKDEV